MPLRQYYSAYANPLFAGQPFVCRTTKVTYNDSFAFGSFLYIFKFSMQNSIFRQIRPAHGRNISHNAHNRMQRLHNLLHRNSKESLHNDDKARRWSKDSKGSKNSKDTVDVLYQERDWFVFENSIEGHHNNNQDVPTDGLTYMEMLQAIMGNKNAFMQFTKLAVSMTEDDNIKLRFCHTVNKYSEAETKKEKLIRGKYIMNTFVADGNIFPTEERTVAQKRLIKACEFGGNQNYGDLELCRDQFLTTFARDAALQPAIFRVFSSTFHM